MPAGGVGAGRGLGDGRLSEPRLEPKNVEPTDWLEDRMGLGVVTGVGAVGVVMAGRAGGRTGRLTLGAPTMLDGLSRGLGVLGRVGAGLRTMRDAGGVVARVTGVVAMVRLRPSDRVLGKLTTRERSAARRASGAERGSVGRVTRSRRPSGRCPTMPRPDEGW